MLVFDITHGLMHATPKFSKVYYKIETQIKDGDPECFFFFVPHLWQDEKHISLFLYQA